MIILNIFVYVHAEIKTWGKTDKFGGKSRKKWFPQKPWNPLFSSLPLSLYRNVSHCIVLFSTALHGICIAQYYTVLHWTALVLGSILYVSTIVFFYIFFYIGIKIAFRLVLNGTSLNFQSNLLTVCSPRWSSNWHNIVKTNIKPN